MKKSSVLFLSVVLAGISLSLFTVLGDFKKQPAAKPHATVTFKNHTQKAGLLKYSPSFSAAAVDLNNDNRDDIFVGNHGYPPSLYVNSKGGFSDASSLLPINNRADRHGYTFLDIDNDGDRDFIYAGGGADGVGKGTSNEAYKNQLQETGIFHFSRDPSSSVVGYPDWRSRQFLPVATQGGERVDLYLTALHKRREGSTNLYFTNTSSTDNFSLEPNEDSSLHQPFESNGMDMFFDFDRDGDSDFLRLGKTRVKLYENQQGLFTHRPSNLDMIKQVQSATAADLNNDGYLDLYLGGISGHTGSDNVENNEKEIHFVIVGQDDDDYDQIIFSTKSDVLTINFVEHLSGLWKARTDASDIFVGAAKANPLSRTGKITRAEAAGRPDRFDQPGSYIWFDMQSQLWNVRWIHALDVATDAKGIISSVGIEMRDKEALETNPPKMVDDYIVMNDAGSDWTILRTDLPHHYYWVNDVTSADFNNDGWVDIVGVRSRDYGKENGTPFIVLNHGGLEFTRHDILVSAEDDIFTADLIVQGFFNNDGLPDLFSTNGRGLLPSHRGPYQYWLNSSKNTNGYLMLEL
ncbi:MAG: VCBS repeat-containing protein, partial [Halioglobus sp.]|nr:VCBS repeat-containing protein [Halioglobus sp.]